MTSRPQSISLRALGTTAVLATTDPVSLPAARGLLVCGLRAFDLACSRFREDSELTGLNRAAGRPLAVCELLWEALQVALRAAELTGGLVDPTVGRTLRLAGYDRTFRLVLQADGLVRPSFASAERWREIELDDDHRTVRLPPGVELDLGATAKALAADSIAAAAGDLIGAGVLVSLGGDVAVAGEAPPGGWTVRIADDHAAPLDTPGPTVALTGGGLASSGTGVRRWPTRAGVLHHIVDPRTGRPANTPWQTVTVAARSCIDANAASTAAVVLGDDAPAWLEARRLPARLAAVDGSVVRVSGWPADASEAA
jgi:thiamine biosynthesis lipoprotein